MNAIVKITLTLFILITLGTAISQLIPSPFTTTMHETIIYFLSSMAPLGMLFHIDTLFTCLKIMLNFMYYLSVLIFLKWITHILTQ